MRAWWYRLRASTRAVLGAVLVLAGLPVVVYAVAWGDGFRRPSWSSAWPFVILGLPPLVVAVNAWMVDRKHLRGRPTPPPAPSASSAGGAAVVDVRLTPVGARHRNPWVVLDGRLTARVHHDRPVRLRWHRECTSCAPAPTGWTAPRCGSNCGTATSSRPWSGTPVEAGTASGDTRGRP